MSAETTTVDLTTVRRATARLVASAHARPPRYRPRHRRRNTDVRAAWGIGVCLAVGVAGYGVLAHLAGMW